MPTVENISRAWNGWLEIHCKSYQRKTQVDAVATYGSARDTDTDTFSGTYTIRLPETNFRPWHGELPAGTIFGTDISISGASEVHASGAQTTADIKTPDIIFKSFYD